MHLRQTVSSSATISFLSECVAAMTLRPERPCEIAGSEPNAAASSVDQNRLSRDKAAKFDERRIGGGVCRTGAAACAKLDAIGNDAQTVCRDAGHIRQTRRFLRRPLPGLRAQSRRLGISFDHFAGQFHAGDEGRLRFELVHPLRHQQVGIIERCGANTDQHIVFGPPGSGMSAAPGSGKSSDRPRHTRFTRSIRQPIVRRTGLRIRPDQNASLAARKRRECLVRSIAAPFCHKRRIVGAQERIGRQLALQLGGHGRLAACALGGDLV